MNKIYNKLKKKKKNFLKNKKYFSILIYFILLFLIDYSGLMDLYGQNFYRRLINMYKRTDYINYKNFLQPFCIKYEKILNNNDIKNLQSIKIPNNFDIGLFSRKNTITYEYKNYNNNDKMIINNIQLKIKNIYEKKINKKLYLVKSSTPTIYKYVGNKSCHLWHVDPNNTNEIYNIIVCIKRKGNISPLQYKDINNKIYSIYFNEGDAALFNGGTTIHQVPFNDDSNSERTVLSLAFTTSKNISNDINFKRNLCQYLEGGNNYFNVIKLLFSIFLINFILTYISGINNLSYKFLILFFIIILIMSKYVPYYFNINLGTGRSSSFYYNIMSLFITILVTFSIKGGTLFLSYFLLSDIFFSKKWVYYL